MFRFSIRDLLLLTLVVAMGVGWWIDRSRLAPFQHRVQFYIDIVAKLQAENYKLKRETAEMESLKEINKMLLDARP